MNIEAESRRTNPVKIGRSSCAAIDRKNFSSCPLNYNAYLKQKRTQKKTCSLFSTIRLFFFFLFWFLPTIIKTKACWFWCQQQSGLSIWWSFSIELLVLELSPGSRKLAKILQQGCYACKYFLLRPITLKLFQRLKYPLNLYTNN